MGDSVREQLAAAVRDALAGRPVLLVGGVARAFKGSAAQLRQAGVERLLGLAEAAGGDPPAPDELEWHLLPADHRPGAPPWERFAELPGPLAERVDVFDPTGEGVVLTMEGSPFTTVHGRPVFGRIPRAWALLESKGTVDAWFDRAGIPRLPSAVMRLDDAGLLAASDALDRGHGVAWSGVDTSPRLVGGARLVRRVRSRDDAAEVRRALAEHVEEVRLAPFVEGIPWGVNALVFPDGVAVGPVVEMVVLRSGSTLRNHGTATFWRPSDEAVAEIRLAVRRVGETLSKDLGYRGCFTLDGVLGAQGPVPTEINARTGGALSRLTQLDPSLAPALLSRLLRAGNTPSFAAGAYEAELMAVSDATPTGFGSMMVEQPWEGDRRFGAVWSGDHYAWTDGDADLEVWAHAMQPRGFLRLVPDPVRTPRGPSVAPRIVAALALAAERFGLALPAWEPARAEAPPAR